MMRACKLHRPGPHGGHVQGQQNTVQLGAKIWGGAVQNHVERVRLMKHHATVSVDPGYAYIQTKYNAPTVNIIIENYLQT